MRANTKLCSAQYSALWKNFQVQMYFELGQENFQSFNHKCRYQLHSSTSTIKVQV